MSTTNVYFTQGTKNEQMLIEDIIIESLKIYGQEVFYIPRTLVSKDEILGEDRLSKFKSSFPIEMYFENVDNFDGQGAFIQKFGLMMEQSATLVVARRRWDQLIGRYGVTTIPTRPCEGDLIYFPLTKGLFEVKFVQHQDPFYQLGKLYVYKLQVELFQYSSEAIDTGNPDIDSFESLKTFNTNTTRNRHGYINQVTLSNPGSGYTSPPTIVFGSSSGYGAAATAILVTGPTAGKVVNINVTSSGTGYAQAPIISFEGGGGAGAAATCTVKINIDKSDSYGDNNKFRIQAADVVFNESNPFGEVNGTSSVTAPKLKTADSSFYTADSTTITSDIG